MIESLPLLIAEQDAPHYETLWQSISPVQKELLIALARDPDTPPFSKDFQLRHRIGPSSSINASLKSLMKKGVLTKRGKGARNAFVDLFFLIGFWIWRGGVRLWKNAAGSRRGTACRAPTTNL